MTKIFLYLNKAPSSERMDARERDCITEDANTMLSILPFGLSPSAMLKIGKKLLLHFLHFLHPSRSSSKFVEPRSVSSKSRTHDHYGTHQKDSPGYIMNSTLVLGLQQLV